MPTHEQTEFIDKGPVGLRKRSFESSETHRLNSAHWTHATDESVNSWLVGQLATMRARANYECKQNGVLKGMVNTHADDIVGPNGPTLQVVSDNPAFNEAVESLWVDWFKAPTPRPNVSGAAMLKLWIRTLWKCGEFLAQIVTDPQAEGPVKLRVKPIAPRRLGTPGSMAGDTNTLMGIQFDDLDRPTRYWIAKSTIADSWMVEYSPVPADLIVHEFLFEEEDQARGVPWLDTATQPSADLRNFDTAVLRAARYQAALHGVLYTDHPDAELGQYEGTELELQEGILPAIDGGYKPMFAPATQPAVQYPEFRSEKQRDFGRPMSMPLMMIRLDASRYNYSSARLETQNYQRACTGVQYWMSGTPQSTGPLSRLVDELIKEARFSIPALRNRPKGMQCQWTWPSRPHVDPTKESNAELIALTSGTIAYQDALAARGTDMETQTEKMRRAREMFEKHGLPLPAWMAGGNALPEDDPPEDDDDEKDKDEEDDEDTADEEEEVAEDA